MLNFVRIRREKKYIFRKVGEGFVLVAINSRREDGSVVDQACFSVEAIYNLSKVHCRVMDARAFDDFAEETNFSYPVRRTCEDYVGIFFIENHMKLPQ